MIPLLIMAFLLGGSAFLYAPWLVLTGGGVLSVLVAPYWISVLFRGRPVEWMFDTAIAIQRFVYRSQTYFMLITDKYPPYEGEWSVSYDVDRPEKLSRWKLVFWKTLAVIPHMIVLTVLGFAVAFCVVVGWFAILFTGKFPLGLRGFVIGWLRWHARVTAYWLSLRDEYPPFSLSPDVRPASRSAHGLAAAGGFVIVAGSIAGIVALVLLLRTTETVPANYAGLLQAQPTATADTGAIEISMFAAEDPYEFRDPPILFATTGNRYVAFGFEFFNDGDVEHEIREENFTLEDTSGDEHKPVLVSLEGTIPPGDIEEGATLFAIAVFELSQAEDPTNLEFEVDFFTRGEIRVRIG
jgi:hypothetical protein